MMAFGQKSVRASRLYGIVCLALLAASSAWTRQLFVAPAGNDTGAGSIDQPFLTITRAVSAAAAGDSIFVRGGVYTLTTRISITKSGNESNRFYLLAFPGEHPSLDYSSMPFGSSNQGISLSGSYWYIRGLDIKGAGDNGMYVSGSYNVVEACAFHQNQDTGLQLGNKASNNRIINCDSYDNVDPGQGNADGFSPKLDVGSGNYFYGCRCWQNSDDGWDGYLRGANDVTTTLENCWSFMNGYLRDGTQSTGNGNGFKTGGSDTRDLMHNMILIRCLAFDNRVKGFDQNNNRGSITLYNCTGYRNGANNYSVADTLAYSRGKVLTVKNCLALGSYGALRNNAVQQTNSWMGWTVTPSDFIGIDTAGVRGPRKPDGSLPDVAFLHLAAGSPLVDAGTDLGLPFNGSAPDLGAFETPALPSAAAEPVLPAATFRLFQNFPNPFNPSTTITYLLPAPGDVRVRVFDARGALVCELPGGRLGAGLHRVEWNGTATDGHAAASGVYFATVSFRTLTSTAKLLLIR